MSMNHNDISDILSLRIFNFRRDDKEEINKLRQKRIEEAISWEGGPSTDSPERIVVTNTPNGNDARFNYKQRCG